MVRPFWHAVLGYAVRGEKVLLDAHRQGPTFWFQQMESPRTGRNRFHIDIYLPHDQVQARIDAALAAGGRIVSDARELQMSIPFLKDGGQGRCGGPEPASSRLSVEDRFCGAPVARITVIR